MKAKKDKEIAKKVEEIQAKLYSAIKEKMKEKDTTPHAREDKMPDAATRNALRHTRSAQMCRYDKIVCASVFDSVAAYVLFKVTKLFFFLNFSTP